MCKNWRKSTFAQNGHDEIRVELWEEHHLAGFTTEELKRKGVP